MGTKFNNKIALSTLTEILNKGLLPEFKFPITIGKELKGNNIAEWGITFDDDEEVYHQLRLNYSKINSYEELEADILHELVHAWLYEQNPVLDEPHGLEFCTWGAYLLFKHNKNIYSACCSREDIVEGINIYLLSCEQQEELLSSQGCEVLVA